ncbi:D-alanyl-D-alanine carboxypeptidase/D-alanyl-D-alanine-endopeptidase [Micromonospora sp. NBC_01405]|uniref:D-alanyl-D-alanine carboxypeptidase/D-alanyl-D-alanine endopeptidase n=1 Tax=Micromonospora sp. NBC_01405 TaxID=2903589 RepID=UPI00324F4456
MGREDSHYRPEGVDGRKGGHPGSGGATGRVPVPEAHLPRTPVPPPADDFDPEATARIVRAGERPPPPVWRPSDRAPVADRVSAPAFPAAGFDAPMPEPAAAGGAGGGPPAGPPPGHDRPPARRRRLPLAVLATVVLLALVGAGLAVVRPGPVAGWLGADRATPQATGEATEPEPVPVLSGPDANAPEPTPDGVRAALEPLLRAPELGSRVNVSVADVTTGRSLYSQGGDAGTVPASVTKLATAVTVLKARGPDHRIPTRAVAGANPGEVVLVGGGDPTLAVDGDGFYPDAARLDDLAKQVKQALGGTAPTRVTVDSSLFPGPVYGPGWDSDIPTGGFGAAISALMTDGARRDPKAAKKNFDAGHGWAERVPQPDLVAGRAFARLLGLTSAAPEVTRGTAPAAGAAPSAAAPAPGAELGKVESLPMIRLVDLMITDSDNVIAEALARQVALARDQPGSFVGGAAAMDIVTGELGLSANEITLADGSGLSRSNRISPSLLTDLISLAGNGTHPGLAAIFGGLPVAAWSGTLGGRYQVPATVAGAGVVRAKTGTLTRVHAIAGLVTTADGRLLTFALLTDQAPPDSLDDTRRALDRITSALARCGCR